MIAPNMSQYYVSHDRQARRRPWAAIDDRSIIRGIHVGKALFSTVDLSDRLVNIEARATSKRRAGRTKGQGTSARVGRSATRSRFYRRILRPTAIPGKHAELQGATCSTARSD